MQRQTRLEKAPWKGDPLHAGPLRRRLRPLRRSASILAGGTVAVAVAAPLMAQAGPAEASKTAATNALTTVVVEKSQSWGQNPGGLGELDGVPADQRQENDSTCTGACTKVWPPVVLVHGQAKPMGHGLSHLGTFRRADGTYQVTYEGIPLYRFAGDVKAGLVTGNGRDKFGQFWVVNPSNPTSVPKASGSGAPPTTAPGGGISY